jgi:hypothetical protein
MTDELLRTLMRDPLALALQAYMLGFVIVAAVTLVAEPLRRWVWPVRMQRLSLRRSTHAVRSVLNHLTP